MLFIKKRKIAEHCRKLGNGKIEPYNTRHGLCREIYDNYQVDIYKLVDFEKYPEFSGDEYYPVKHPWFKDARDAYQEQRNLLWVGEYGEARRKFCLWVADEITRKYLWWK